MKRSLYSFRELIRLFEHIIEKDKKLHNIASYDLARRARGSARAPFFCTPTCWVDQVYKFWYLYHHHNVKIDETKVTQSFSIFRKMSFSTKFFSKNEFSKKMSNFFFFQTNRSQRVLKLHWWSNDQKISTNYELYESKVFYPPY